MFRQPHSGFNRVPFVQACTVVWDGLETSCLTCNLSILGLYVHLEAPLERSREVTQLFMLVQRVNDDYLFLHPQTRRCTVYEKRPDVCRQFPQTMGIRPGYCPKVPGS